MALLIWLAPLGYSSQMWCIQGELSRELRIPNYSVYLFYF